MALLITFLTGVSIIVGALVIKLSRDPERIEQISIALALGAMGAIAALDVIPEILEIYTGRSLLLPALLVLAGVGLLKLLDLFIPEHDHDGRLSDAEAAHIGTISAVALVLHNIVEGMTVYSLSLTSLRQGAVVALGIGLHNIPMGMLIYSMLQRERRPVKYAVFAVVSLSTLIGGLLLALVTAGLSELVTGALMCVALGMLLYIMFFELLPHTVKSRPVWLSAAGVAAGFALVLVSSLFG
ncbi:MAG: ZIP family metal transporter [Oscillospiraceae bacterium]|nr:ZIP family metal transporter [Oscillospiraceae bacterium]MBR6431164.1 ZIP family metal transporter [Oscillospiraceae bacterium]